LYLTTAVPMASAGSAGTRCPIVGDSTALEGELLEGSVFDPEPFFTFFLILPTHD